MPIPPISNGKPRLRINGAPPQYGPLLYIVLLLLEFTRLALLCMFLSRQFFVVQIMHFQNGNCATGIFPDEEEIYHPHEIALLDRVQFRHNLFRELMTFALDHHEFKWADGHVRISFVSCESYSPREIF